MKKNTTLFVLFILTFSHLVSAQNVTITPNGITPVLAGNFPRLSYDSIAATPSPETGDIAYDLTFLCLRVFNGTKWVCTYQDPLEPNLKLTALTSAGGSKADLASSIAVDSSGNVFIVGRFQESAEFGDITVTTGEVDDYDAYIAKYNGSGVIQWVETAGGGGNQYIYDIVVDRNGNVLITGSFDAVVNFGEVSKVTEGGNDCFIAKYNSAGILQWAHSGGGPLNDFGTGIDVDSSGDVFMTGSFSGTVIFGTFSRTSAGQHDIFVKKYNSSGDLQWVDTAGGPDQDFSTDIALNADGEIFLTGSFENTASFGGLQIDSDGNSDVFVAKYALVGLTRDWVWAKSGGSTNNDSASDIAIDDAGNIFATGYFRDTLNFIDGADTISNISAGWEDIFVVKYNSLGGLIWAQSGGGVGRDFARGIVIDANDNVIITGSIEEEATFEESIITSVGASDIFTAKYDNLGSLQWVRAMGGTQNDRSYGIAVDIFGDAFITGSFNDEVKFGPITKTAVGETGPQGSTDIFVVRIQE